MASPFIAIAEEKLNLKANASEVEEIFHIPLSFFKNKPNISEKITNLENLSEDLTAAARHALIQMIDYIVREHGLTREQAYILCSVAVDLRVGQVVDVPNFIITAVLNLDVFDKYRN